METHREGVGRGAGSTWSATTGQVWGSGSLAPQTNIRAPPKFTCNSKLDHPTALCGALPPQHTADVEKPAETRLPLLGSMSNQTIIVCVSKLGGEPCPCTPEGSSAPSHPALTHAQPCAAQLESRKEGNAESPKAGRLWLPNRVNPSSDLPSVGGRSCSDPIRDSPNLGNGRDSQHSVRNRIRPISSKCAPESANLAQVLTNFGQDSTKFGRDAANVGQA